MQGTVSLRSVHGKYLSAQPDGRAEWNRDHASTWEYFQVEQRYNGKIALKGAHGMYVSAQLDGSVQINRREAPPGGWEEFTVEDRGNNVVCLRSCHGKYLSAQQNGTAQWNRDHAPRGGWEEIQIGLSNQPRTQGQYMFVPEEMAWNEHNDRAKAMGRHLATISSAEENEEVTRISGGKPVWIGGIRKGSGNGPGADHWYWSDGQPWTYTNWYHGEPNNSGGAENRVHLGLQARGTWNDVDERWRGPAVYEMPAISPTKASSNEQVNFEFIPISEYDEVWNDSGSGAEQDVSVWRPRVPAGCHLIGMTAKNGHSRPTFSSLVIRAGGRDIAPPERFDLVWWQERGKRRFWCWRPIPPAGYVSLGDVGTTSETPPSRKDVVCVSLACLSPNRQPLGGQIWNDRGGGAPKDAAFFAQPGGTGLFRCSDDATHNKPHGEFPIPAGASTSPHTTLATNGIEILEAVVGKPIRFRISNRPSSNDAWVGIYPPNALDQDHGEENKRWKWLRNLDANNASFPKQALGDWSIRVFSDGGHSLHERKDFQVKAQTVESQPFDETAEKPGRGRIGFVALFGLFLLIPGLPLLIIGTGSTGEDRLGMIIPGAILTGVGGFLAVGAWFALISSWTRSNAARTQTAPRWTKFGAVFAVLLLGPGVTLLVIGSISAESFVAQSESNATLEIFDVDDMGDQGFIIFIEAVLGDFDNNGIYDHCEDIIVSATHSGSWTSDPWTGYQKVNPPDESRQVFELGQCESGDHVQQKHKDGRNIIKMGQACYGCMKGTTTISAEYSDGSEAAVMWIQDGEEVVGAIGMIIGGSIMTGLSSIAIISLLIIWGGSSRRKQDDSQKSSIDILEATTNKGVYFRINNPPTSNDAWVGIYPRGGEDSDHGEEGVRWHWLRDIDVNKARFYEKSEGRWSIRIFSDSGYTLDSQDDFEIVPKDDQWWKD